MPLCRLVFGCSLLVLLALAGCRSEPEPPPETAADERDSIAAAPAEPTNPFADPARRALRIELGLDDYRTVEGTWATGDTSSTFTAYFAGDTLRFIEERMHMGEIGESTNVYYFEDDALFYAVQDEARTRLGVEEGTRHDTSQVHIAFDARGDVIASERIVNGDGRSVRDMTVRGVRSHAAELRDRAHELWEEAAGPAV